MTSETGELHAVCTAIFFRKQDFQVDFETLVRKAKTRNKEETILAKLQRGKMPPPKAKL